MNENKKLKVRKCARCKQYFLCSARELRDHFIQHDKLIVPVRELRAIPPEQVQRMIEMKHRIGRIILPLLLLAAFALFGCDDPIKTVPAVISSAPYKIRGNFDTYEILIYSITDEQSGCRFLVANQMHGVAMAVVPGSCKHIPAEAMP